MRKYICDNPHSTLVEAVYFVQEAGSDSMHMCLICSRSFVEKWFSTSGPKNSYTIKAIHNHSHR